MRNTKRYLEGLEQRGQGIIAWEVLISQDDMEDFPTAQRQYEIQKGMQEPVVYAASMNPDIMYLHEAMKAPDYNQFKKAMDKELMDHIARKHWEVVPRSEVPKGMRVLGMAQRTQWPTTTQHQLLGDVCASRYLSNYPLLLHIGNHQGMANPPNRLRVDIYSSTSRSPLVHEVSSRI